MSLYSIFIGVQDISSMVLNSQNTVLLMIEDTTDISINLLWSSVANFSGCDVTNVDWLSCDASITVSELDTFWML